MKRVLIAASLLVSTTVHANLIEKLLNFKPKKDTIIVDGHEMELTESNVFPGKFFYKLTTKTPSTETISDDAVARLNNQLKEAGYRDVKITKTTIPVDPQPTVVTEEQSQKTIEDTNELIYGDDGVMEDPYVIEAWNRANEAKERLEKHREYMRRVMKSRKRVEEAKKIEAGLEPDSPEST